MYEKLKKIGSPKVKKGNINIYSENDEDLRQNEELDKIRKGKYNDKYSDRLSNKNMNIYPKGFDGIVFYCEEIEYSEFISNITKNATQLENLIIIVEDSSLKEKLTGEQIIENSNISISIEVGDGLTYGKKLNQAFKYFNHKNFSLILSPNIVLSNNFRQYLSKFVINPGTYHYNYFANNEERKLDLISVSQNLRDNFIILFNTNAYALKLAGYDGISKTRCLTEFEHLWESKKKIAFEDSTFEDDLEVMNIKPQGNYVVYGTGKGGVEITNMLKTMGANIKYYCDSNENKWNTMFLDKKIISPIELLEKRSEYDRVIIASIALAEIRSKILEVGLTENDIVAPALNL
jgi:hypothetical protein